ncbi:hypothetical protein BAUCODRAFT_382033 [Baudoinia panamericana UAMH 10762]|uniref:mRNA-capping enzyme subunit alpha n=1 Tax=Baudoinia panamericana (strain UAMH 10762) TaxID=717646 RepID=M2NIC6_BAUPA|nr:uncharacterized protein BAUCODRAFT_382033 [Baudoinia panamericana UAMH 10762]EMC98845.1 hypothetical protein BAUCODRAFT_382033 [Baudoinia panamericana UAMH 10762]
MGSSVDLAAVGTKLTNEEAHIHKDRVADILGRKVLTFPGSQPVSFAREHIQTLQNEDYFLCEKTDGVRCLLYLTQWVNEHQEPSEMQLLIDRKNDYYCVPIDSLHLPTPSDRDPRGFDIAGFHKGTLLDGELVSQKQRDGTRRLAYLIFDMLALDEENIMPKTFAKRYARIQERVMRPYRKFSEAYRADVQAQPFALLLKEMQAPYGTEMMFRDVIPKLPHGNDGLIFTPVNEPYVPGTDRGLLKWKPPHENTIDFRLQIGSFPMIEHDDGDHEDWDAKPEIELLVNHGGGKDGGDKYFAMLTLTDQEWEAMKSMNQQFDHRIIECWRDHHTGQWRPKLEEDGTPRFRDDKDSPNHISTVESVIQSIKDAVTQEDLVKAAGKIRTAFKARLQIKQDEEKRRAAAEAEQRRKREDGRSQQHAQAQARDLAHKAPQAPHDAGIDDGPSYSE